MAVKLWWAKRPYDHPSEHQALQRLVKALAPLAEQFFVLANFRLPNAQIDFLIISEFGIYLVDVKNSRGLPVFGGLNGTWQRADGVSFPANPVDQIIHQYRQLRAWLEKNQAKFLSANQINSLQNGFKDIKKFIALYPCKHPKSRLALEGESRLCPYLGEVIGIDELPSRLLDPSWRGRLGITLGASEIQKLAKLLGLQPARVDQLQEQRLNRLGIEASRELNQAPSLGQRLKRWGVAALGLAVVLAGTVGFLPRESVWVGQLRQSDIGKRIDLVMEVQSVKLYRDSVFLFPKGMPPGAFSVQVKGKESFAAFRTLEGKCLGLKRVLVEQDSDGDPQVQFATAREAQEHMRESSGCVLGKLRQLLQQF